MEKFLNLAERFVVALERLAIAAAGTPSETTATVAVEKAVATATGPTAAEKAAATKKANAEKAAAEKAAKDKAAAEEADMLGTATPEVSTVTVPILQGIVSKLLAAGVVPKATIKGVIETVGNAPSISTIKPENYQATFDALSAL